MLDAIKYFLVGLSTLLGVHSPAVLPQPTPTPVPVQEYTASGIYTFYGFKVQYHIDLPKSGGDIKGMIKNDFCEGQVTGNYSGGRSGKLSGELTGNCQILFIKQPLNATYTGQLKDGRTATVDYTGSVGNLSNSGSLNLGVF